MMCVEIPAMEDIDATCQNWTYVGRDVTLSLSMFGILSEKSVYAGGNQVF